jgi:hypothetical protein
MHMISHFAEQIQKYGQLPQYSTEIGEAYHKPLKEAYDRTNRINATAQILKIYDRDHAFAMKELNHAARDGNDSGAAADIVPAPILIASAENSSEDSDDSLEGEEGDSYEGPQVLNNPEHLKKSFVRLQGPQYSKEDATIQHIADKYNIPDMEEMLAAYFKLNYPTLFAYDTMDPCADFDELLAGPVQAFSSLRIHFPSFQGGEYVDHIVRSTGSRSFRGKGCRSDWVWVSLGNRGNTREYTAGGLNDRVPGKLNCIFKVRIKRGEGVCRLAHITLMTIVGARTTGNEEGMWRVKRSNPARNVIVPIRTIVGMAHLVPIEPNEVWFINNRIDLETWNMVYN